MMFNDGGDEKYVSAKQKLTVDTVKPKMKIEFVE
jgi:hypothetical protein